MYRCCLESCPLGGCFLLMVISLTLGKSKLMVILMIFGKSKLILQRNSLRRNLMPEQLSGLFIHATSTSPWILRPTKVSTSSELYPKYFRLPTFLHCSDIQFFYSPSFPNTVSWSTFGYLPLTVQHLCDLQNTMPCQPSPGASDLTLT